MAQTRQSQRRRSGASGPKSGASRNGAGGGRSRNGRPAQARSNPVDFVKEHAQRAGGTLDPIAEKATKPALAAGAALAGLAAGLALAPRGSRRLSDLPDAARSVTTAGGTVKALLRTTRELHATACTINDVASELRQLRELAQVGRNRSPIEVVLQGLTRRPQQ